MSEKGFDLKGCYDSFILFILSLPFMIVGWCLAMLIGPALWIQSYTKRSLSLLLGGIAIFLIAGTLLRISQSISTGHFKRLFTLKYWKGKDETFKFN